MREPVSAARVTARPAVTAVPGAPQPAVAKPAERSDQGVGRARLAESPPARVVAPSVLPSSAPGVAGELLTAVVAAGSALTVPAAPTPAVGHPSDDGELIRQTLRTYAAAMSAMDVDRLATVVRMNAATRSRQEALFAGHDALTMRLMEVGEPRPVAGGAIVRCLIQETVARGGRRSAGRESEVEISLERIAGRWMITGVRER
jgi:hypothetical protein